MCHMLFILPGMQSTSSGPGYSCSPFKSQLNSYLIWKAFMTRPGYIRNFHYDPLATYFSLATADHNSQSSSTIFSDGLQTWWEVWAMQSLHTHNGPYHIVGGSFKVFVWWVLPHHINLHANKAQKQPQLFPSAWRYTQFSIQNVIYHLQSLLYPPATLASIACHQRSSPSEEQEVARLETSQLDVQTSKKAPCVFNSVTPWL